jgi:hypothetical protein
MRDAARILRDIAGFQPTGGEWLPLEDLLRELWDAKPTEEALPVLFGVFERFPDDDGAGVLWTIVHGVEDLPFEYETVLRESYARTPSTMAETMLLRIANAARSGG